MWSVNLELGVMQNAAVPRFSKKYCSEITKTRHFKRKIQLFFCGGGPAPSQTPPGGPHSSPNKALRPSNSNQIYLYELTLRDLVYQQFSIYTVTTMRQKQTNFLLCASF